MAVDDQVPVVRGSITGFEVYHPDRHKELHNVADRSAFVPLDERSFWIPWWHPCHLFSRSMLVENGISYPALRDGEDPVFLASVLVAAPRMSTVSDVTYRYRMAPLEARNPPAKISEICGITFDMLGW